MKNEIDLRFAVIQYSPNNKLSEGIKRAINQSNKYHPQPIELKKKLAKKFKVTPDMILLTSGADEAIQLLGRKYLRNIVYFYPTYVEYSKKNAFRAKKVTGINSLQNSTYKIPIRKYKTSSLIFIANPNNPFGYTTRKDLLRLINLNLDSHIVVDEAYGGFAPNLTLASDVKDFKNLIVLKSFSKDYALAGIRIGFVIAQPEVIKELETISLVSNVSYPSVIIALNALKHEDYSKKIIKKIINDRRVLENFISDFGWKIFESKTNIITVKFDSPIESNNLVDYLQKSGIYISLGNGGANVGLDNTFIRIVVGTSSQNIILMNVIKRYGK